MTTRFTAWSRSAEARIAVKERAWFGSVASRRAHSDSARAWANYVLVFCRSQEGLRDEFSTVAIRHSRRQVSPVRGIVAAPRRCQEQAKSQGRAVHRAVPLSDHGFV